MVKQYPYILQKLVLTGDTINSNGDVVPGTSEWVHVCYCRNEENKSRSFTNGDGIFFKANHKIQCKKGTPAIDTNTTIRVYDPKDNVIRVLGQVAYSDRSQLHTVVWV